VLLGRNFETEAKPKITRLSRGQGICFGTEAKPRQRDAKTELRPQQAKRYIEAASRQGCCLED